MKKNKMFQKLFILLIIAMILVGGVVIIKNKKKNKDGKNTTANQLQNDILGHEATRIRIEEDLDGEKAVKNLDNVVWNRARVMQYDGEISVSIDLNSRTKEKVSAKELTINLLNSSGKVVHTKKVKMEAIDGERGYTSIEYQEKINDIILVTDIEIIA